MQPVPVPAPQTPQPRTQRCADWLRRLLLHLFARDRVMQLRQLAHTVQEMDGATNLFVLLQWAATIFLALSLAHYNVVSHRETRLLMLAAAVLSGPLTGLGVLRATHRMRSQRFQRQHLLHCVRHDELTGLPNRADMRTQLTTALVEAHTRNTCVTCLYMDLDGLRFANVLLGYRAGDELLQEIVRRISGCLAPTDHFSRFGGDKFVVLLHRTISRPEIDALAECIVHCVSRPLQLNHREFMTGVSIGIASFPADATAGDALLAAAERAMYTVKRTGRSAFLYAEQRENAAEIRSRVLAEKLQYALHCNGLHLNYQPIYSIDGKLVAAEALSRWHDEAEGNISPAEFIPVAEATGLIVPLSKWVLRRACEQMKAWLALGSSIRRIAVNICVLQVSRGDFVSTVERTLCETGLPPECLELEVTESSLAQDFDSVKLHLERLRRLGVRISIDDFGTGYSSFGRLRDLQADTLKIDRSFVQGAHDAQNGVAVVQALVDMAHTLQLSVVAEGVETQQQLDMLRSIHCDELQGFLLARPQPSEGIRALLLHTVQQRPASHAAIPFGALGALLPEMM